MLVPQPAEDHACNLGLLSAFIQLGLCQTIEGSALLWLAQGRKTTVQIDTCAIKVCEKDALHPQKGEEIW